MAVLKARLAARRPGVPHSLFLGLTARCDLACRHCKYAGRAGGADMPRALLRRLLTAAAAAGVPRVVFFGGEPLLYPGLQEAAAFASRLGLFTELDTNGQTLTPARARALAAAGLSCAMISLHAASAARHDALSGRGSFARAAAAIKASRCAGLITYMSSCVFSAALGGRELPGLLAYAKLAGAHGARLLAYAPPAGRDPLPARLAGRLERLSPEGYARTCALPGGGCAATAGDVLYCGPGGEVRSCPYAGAALGNAGRRGLAAFLRPRSAAAPLVFPCQGGRSLLK
jgi:MoaA/NifB/PqqE/SkfB family radical SAM enzyme